MAFSFAQYGLYLQYLGAALLMTVLFAVVYERITPMHEWKWIAQGSFGANHLVCHRLPRPAPLAQRIGSEQYRRGPVFGALGNRGGHTQCRQPGRWLNRHIGNTQKGNQHVELYPQAVY